MSKIVINGGSGLIDLHIPETLVSDHEVIIIDNLDKNNSPLLKQKIHHVFREKIRFMFINGDFSELLLMHRVIDDTVAFLYHEDMHAGVRISIEDPLKPNSVNVTSTLTMLQVTRDAEVNM